MSLRSSLNRLAIAVAAGALVTAAAVTPAVADEGWGDDDPGAGRQDDSWNQGDDDFDHRGDSDQHGDHGDHGNDPHLYRGVVTVKSLALRSRPDRGSKIIRYAHRGEYVSIFCKTGGDSVGGNPLWYLLTDGTWAWGPARHIDNIGAAPRWC